MQLVVSPNVLWQIGQDVEFHGFNQFSMMDSPNFKRKEYTFLIRLFIVLPIGISSAERSFSVLRRIKNFMRSTMSRERTSGWPQLAIERELES